MRRTEEPHDAGTTFERIYEIWDKDIGAFFDWSGYGLKARCILRVNDEILLDLTSPDAAISSPSIGVLKVQTETPDTWPEGSAEFTVTLIDEAEPFSSLIVRSTIPIIKRLP